MLRLNKVIDDRTNIPDERGNAAPTRHELAALLLSSDLAAEVRSEFNEHISHGLDVADATSQVFAQFREALVSPNDGPVVILALAILQMNEGALHAVIRDAAIELIDSGEALAAFPAATGDLKKSRRRLLEQFAEELGGAEIVDQRDE